MNQITLANLLGKPPVYVHNAIKKKTIDTGKLKEIADALEVSITYFFDEGDNSNKEDKRYCTCSGNDNINNFFGIGV